MEILALSFFHPREPFAWLLSSAFLYSAAGAAVAAAVTAALLLSRAGRRLSFAEAKSLYPAAMIPAFLFLALGGYINAYFFPVPKGLFWLFFYGLLLALAAGLGWVIYRFGMGGRWKLWMAVGAVAAAVGAWALFLPQVKGVFRPEGLNVLLITVDAMRPDHMSLHGYGRETTPRLQELAGEGAVFTHAYANSSWTVPSVPTMFTSLYPSTHNVLSRKKSKLSDSLVLMPEIFKKRGYATGIFSANPWVSPVFGYDQGVDRFFFYRRERFFDQPILGHYLSSLSRFSAILSAVWKPLRQRFFPQRGTYELTGAPGLNAAFLSWLDRLQGKPFFAYFHYMEPHTPYAPPPPFSRMFQDPQYAGAPPHYPPLSLEPYPFAVGQALGKPEHHRLVAAYDGALRFLDQELGKLFQALKDREQYERTLIIVTADHGEEFYDHFGWDHGRHLFNELIRVPLIVRGGGIEAGQVRDIPARHIDILPTVLDLAGIKPQSTMEGRSLAPLLRNARARMEPLPVYAETYRGQNSVRCVVKGPWKLIDAVRGKRRIRLLYHLEKDPGEREPLDPDRHPEALPLEQILEDFSLRLKEGIVAGDEARIDPDLNEKLRSLGYVQ